MIEQGSEEWHQQRLGKLTASRISLALAKTKSGWGASRENLKALLVTERLTQTPQEGYTNAAMAHGTATEPQARAAYEWDRDVDVDQISFIDHPSLNWSGCSPDGLVGSDGLVEIKCPNSSTHIASLLGGKVDRKYIYQMQWQMAVTGRQWCDFCSFDPRLPAEMQLLITRIDRDDGLIQELEREGEIFLMEVEKTHDRLRALYLTKEQAA